MKILVFVFVILFVIGCADSNETNETRIKEHTVYTARTFEHFDSTMTDTFNVGEKIFFGARSSTESGKGEKFECSKIIIGVYQLPNEKIITMTEVDVAPDWTGTRQDVSDELPDLEPGEYIVRFIKSPSNEVFAKGTFVVIQK